MFTRSNCSAGAFSQLGGDHVNNRPQKSVTLSMRVSVEEAEGIHAAAHAANLSRAEYLYRRVTDRPVTFRPSLAALAELICTLRRLERIVVVEPDLVSGLRGEITRLCEHMTNSVD